ncbi:MAG: acetyl-CoA carboxylase carboxyltransferase subunit alpha [Chlamydiia bacterium]|nr:acetyl-CoA carboxylase carboxyltransferase subunit alpha [Chlamydiia bacterium]
MAELLPHEKQLEAYVQAIDKLKSSARDETLPSFAEEVDHLEKKLSQVKGEIYAKLTPWERVTISRHPERPKSSDYIEKMTEEFHALAGDRCFGEDTAVVGGLATIGPMSCVLIGQEKGKDTESRLHHNFGMLNPEGYRKALRLMRLAEKFHLPVVLLLDTPGANPTLEAEERGQGWAIAQNLKEMAQIATPMIIVVIGEGCSGGALGMGIGDAIGMLEHAYYSVISPEGCASILWKSTEKKADAAAMLKLNAENMYHYRIIDTIIKEPLGGAHHQPDVAIDHVKQFILASWRELKDVPPELLLEKRYVKFRQMGQYNLS